MAMAVFRREGRRLLPLLPSIALRPISAVRSPLSSDQKVSNGVGYSTVNGECKFDLAKKEGEKFPPKYQRNKNTSIISKVEKREVHAYLENVYDNVVIVDNVSAAKTVVKKLRDKYNNRVHSCYTKVSGIDVKSETPVDHGELISFSVYCGTKADFGKGKSCIWVDVLGENGMEVFRPYFEDSSIKKVWHNYSVHSHTIRNHGIEISGFHADTLHMARLWDSSRPTEDEYSLEALRSDPKVLSGTYTKEELELVGKQCIWKRWSCPLRRPNLQSRSALENDRYKIGKAIVASHGNSLIVADYGELSLRILAHLAGCKSMIQDFKAGGDFHSRTAMYIYPHIREAVENGEVVLEWHPQPGEDRPPVPLLKDAFASERRKAMILNYSLAIGKSEEWLSRVWKVSWREAYDAVYNTDREEVMQWYFKHRQDATEAGYLLTLLGRVCRFPGSKSKTHKYLIPKAAFNAPVQVLQGSVADVAMCSMLEISKNQRLREFGWRLVLQFHDEVILEGPMESAEIAKGIIVGCMSKPFNGENILSVDLSVDAKCAQNWYDAIKA